MRSSLLCLVVALVDVGGCAPAVPMPTPSGSAPAAPSTQTPTQTQTEPASALPSVAPAVWAQRQAEAWEIRAARLSTVVKSLQP
jgi:hypothetical protein